MKRMKWLKIKTPKDSLYDLLKVIEIGEGVKGFSPKWLQKASHRLSC